MNDYWKMPIQKRCELTEEQIRSFADYILMIKAMNNKWLRSNIVSSDIKIIRIHEG